MLRKCPFVIRQGVWAAQSEAWVSRSVILFVSNLQNLSEIHVNSSSTTCRMGRIKLTSLGLEISLSPLLLSATTSQIKEGKKSPLAWHGDNESFSTLLPAIYLSRTLHCYPKFWGECSQKWEESGIMNARNARYSWIHFLSLELGTRHWDNFSHLVWTASQSQSLFYIVQLLAPAWFCLLLYNGESKFFSH